jgi:hypothetical protein
MTDVMHTHSRYGQRQQEREKMERRGNTIRPTIESKQAGEKKQRESRQATRKRAKQASRKEKG